MKLNLFLILSILPFSSVLHADSPPVNTIPVVGLKPAPDEIDVDFLCFLSWNNFDGLSRGGYSGAVIQEKLVIPADSTGMLAVVNPNELIWMLYHWTRMFPFTEDEPFVFPVWKNYSYGGTTYTEDGIIDSRTVSECITYMQQQTAILDTLFNRETHSVWFYYGYDEAPALQWARMLVDTIDGTPAYYDDFIPNLFTRAMDSVYRPDLGLSRDTVWQPVLQQVDPRGVLSWMNWYVTQADSTREIGYIISCMHTLNDWAGATNINEGYDSIPPNAHNQAQAVRAIFNMQYQGAPVDATPDDNYPSFVALDAYPFRLVGTAYQDTASYTPQLGDSLEFWLIDHYEEVMDSTFITTWNIRNDDNKDISVFFVPQAFGRAGGENMWLYVDTLDKYILNYGSYAYRIPTPQEFRMTCNIALLRGAKAILPYCLTSYAGGDGNSTDAGLLDENNIPFNAPYEEWVYTERPKGSLTYISPDSIPPFMKGYDPLYTLSSRPIAIPGSQRNRENFLLWKFGPYGRLWNSVRKTFGEIARVAPELALLNWWENHESQAEIDYGDFSIPLDFADPHIRVFTDSTESNCYLYYLNRFCRANDNPFAITVDASDYPVGTPFSEYALDHSRRFLIEGENTGRGEFTYLDTLNAGEARLLQMINGSSIRYADIRITDPDITPILTANNDTLSDYRSVPGETVDICARFYNMGMGSLTDVEVYLYDDTNNEMLDTQYVSFNGLDTNLCYRCDRDDAIFRWVPKRNDIGVHRLRVYTESIFLEPDPSDNTARLVYAVKPRDYATKVLDNPWDMTELPPPVVPPAWHTNSITAIGGEWVAAGFTDSISGMFEGVLSTAISGPILRGDISLAVDENKPIDTDVFRNLSFAAVCINPNPNATSSAGAVVHLWWVDSHGDTTSVNISNESEIGAMWNGDTLWREYGPLDLSTVSGSGWSSEEAVEFWLSFRTGKSSPPIIPEPVDIRLGWVKLTE